MHETVDKAKMYSSEQGPTQQEVQEYIFSLTGSLRDMARNAGLNELAEDLENIRLKVQKDAP